MDIGLSTAVFYPESTENTVERLRMLGVKKTEVFLEASSEGRPHFYKPLRKMLDNAGIEVVSVHGFVAGYEPFLFSDYKRRADDAMYELEAYAEAGAYLGAKFYTFHGNRLEYYKSGFDFVRYSDTFTRICRAVKASGLTLAWENVSWCQSASREFLVKTAELTDNSLYGYTLDLKQAIRANESIFSYLELMGSRLLNIHISDSDEKNVCVLPGNGNFDFGGFFKRLCDMGYTGDVITEVYSDCYTQDAEIKKALEYLEETKNECKNA